MISRLWYPQLDVYDTIRRLGLLLQLFDSSPGPERLYIADFFLANPPLIHKTTMNIDDRKELNLLGIQKPEKSFLSYPAAPLLFSKMESVQNEAMRALIGKGLVSVEKLEMGRLEISEKGRSVFSLEDLSSTSDLDIANFLVTRFCGNEEIGNKELRRKSGLRRVI